MESTLNNSINELNKIREKINNLHTSGKEYSQKALELLEEQLKNISRTLELLDAFEIESDIVASAEETIPVNIKQVVGMSLENAPVAESVEVIKQEEPTIVSVQKSKPVKEPTPSGKQEKPDNSLGAKMKSKPIKDLKTAIGINEKFAFIKLFGGDATAWSNALQKLNSFSAYWEAEAMLDEFRKKYNWKEEDETLQALIELVQRRYM